MIDWVLRGLGSYDSQFNYKVINESTNAELIVSLSIFLRQIAAGTVNDTDGTAFTAVNWDAKSWTAWTKRFQREAQAYWNGKFWLKTPNTCDCLNFTRGAAGHKYRCNVWCRFKLELA